MVIPKLLEKCVVMAVIWSDPTYGAVSEALKCPIINGEHKIASHMKSWT